MLRRTFVGSLLASRTPVFSATKPRLNSLSGFLRKSVEKRRVPAVVVLLQQHGKPIFHEAFGYAVRESGRKIRLDDIFMLASSSKPIACTTIMTLVDQGRLSLDEPVRKFFPEFPGGSTIRRLLSHTSGIFGNDAEAEELEAIRNFDRELKEAVEIIVRQPLAYEPGAKYSYGGASMCVAGRIAEIVTGMDFDAYMEKALLAPLGMKDTFYRTSRDVAGRVPQIYHRAGGEFEKMKAVMEPPGRRGPRADGFILVPGGIYSTARDTVRFLQMHLNGGPHNGERILSKAAVEEMQKKQTGALDTEYGLGWQRREVDAAGNARVVGHGGAYGTDIWIDRKRNLAGAAFTQMPYSEVRPFLEEIRARVEKVL